MRDIKELLSKRDFTAISNIDAKTIESIFFEILGKEVGSVERSDIWEVQIKDRKILVRTIHPAVASEVWRKREKIRNKINKELGKEMIKEIKVQ
jgi:hypothetical protein